MSHSAVLSPEAPPRKDSPLPTAGPEYREAFQRAVAAARALPLGELVTVDIDVPSAVTTSIGVLSRIRSFRPVIVKALPGFDLVNIDQLETYTLATAHAHAIYVAASAPPDPLAELMSDASALRDKLYSDAVALANRGLVSGARLADYNGAASYENIAFDLLRLTALLRQAWPQIEGKTALALAELASADLIGAGLVKAVAACEQSPSVPTGVTQLRQRMFTLFANAWDQVRRALSYLRWSEDDVDTIAPSLYVGRPRLKTDLPPAPGDATGTPRSSQETLLRNSG
jgi:hypothetical protein